MRLQYSNKKIFYPKHRLQGGKLKNVKQVVSNIEQLTKQFDNITGKKPKKFTLKI